ncbi:MAG TPA: hypothetical protein VHE13_07525, partial [Opitutus sp.]|nr:hypothetical protein [Opitutus sp.]
MNRFAKTTASLIAVAGIGVMYWFSARVAPDDIAGSVQRSSRDVQQPVAAAASKPALPPTVERATTPAAAP